MKHCFIGLLLSTLYIPITTMAQETEHLSHFTIGFDAGTGHGGHNNCYDTWGYFTVGSTAEYRLKRRYSLEASLHYINLEGARDAYANPGRGFDLTVFQQLHNAALMVGPSVHIPFRNGFELSLAPKAGMMLNIVSQDVQNYGQAYQLRHYSPDVMLANEVNVRGSWWLTERLAFECVLGYFGNTDAGKASRLNYIEGQFSDGNNVELPELFVQDLSDRRGELRAINLSMGIRFRL